jgi:hypothetical protein
MVAGAARETLGRGGRGRGPIGLFVHLREIRAGLRNFLGKIAGFADTSFDDFDLWLRRLREEKLISFGGASSLLSLPGLPVRDPMIVAPYSYLSPEEPRVAAGTLFSDGERFGVDALIMIVISHDKGLSFGRTTQRALVGRASPSLMAIEP